MQKAQYPVLPSHFPESWASDWGEDEYGLWMGFTYKGVRQDFRWIEPGAFMMGAPKHEEGYSIEEVQHEVKITNGFWLADTTVTQALWVAVIGDNPSSYKGNDYPVERVSWLDVQKFMNRLNQLKPELRLCLPTEAQWEYSCRAGSTTAFHFGDGFSSTKGNFRETVIYNEPGNIYRNHLMEVRSFSPNDWGLYEMHGNIREWCHDLYGKYSSRTLVKDPHGTDLGKSRVIRGGSWQHDARCCRSAFRSKRQESTRSHLIGFRLARSSCYKNGN